MDQFSSFAEAIYKQKYAHKKADGSLESWEEIADRVAWHVCVGTGVDYLDMERIKKLIVERKFLPGGRYLYAAGRPFHQVQNCFSGNTRVLTDRGIFDLEQLEGCKVRLRNRHGQWEDAEVRGFGKQEIFEVVLSNGEVIETTAGHLWWQQDGSRVPTTELEQVLLGRTEEMPELDAQGVRHGVVFGDGHLVKGRYSQIVFVNKEKGAALSSWFTSEARKVTVGFGAQVEVETVRETKRGTVVSLQPLYFKSLPCPESLTPEYARGFMAGLIATDGHVSKSGSVGVSCEGLSLAKRIAEIAVLGGCVVTSVRVSSKTSPFTGEPRELCTVFIKPASAPILLPSHQANVAERSLVYRKMYLNVEDVRATGRFEPVYCAVVPGSESFTLANGVVTSNCLLLRADDSREGWADLMQKSTMALMTGAGIGVDYSAIRAEGSPISRTGGKSTGPLALMEMLNCAGRGIMQGGARRSAIWAGLAWDHADVLKFVDLKNWSEDVRRLKEKDFNFPAPMDGTNISVILDKRFFDAYEKGDEHAHKVYWTVVRNMLETGEPGFSVNYDNPRESLRNACTEITSEDDSDICNLGSLNMARFDTLDEFKKAVELGTIFLLAGTLYSDVPYEKVRETREKNRRLGLGLMGIHEWLLKRGYRYGDATSELAEWMGAYQTISDETARRVAAAWGISAPVKTRSIAPNGTISICAETTGGIEPVFCTAFRRRYKANDGHTTQYQYVIDPTAKRLIESGIKPEDVEDAYTLAKDVERRVAFQAWVQQYVDHSISSTINLPAWGSELNNTNTVQSFGEMLLKYLPKLRGITCYPDGARDGQPLVPVQYQTAISKVGQVFIEQQDACDISGNGGSCGS